MKTITFLAVTLLSGTIAGTFLGVINQGIVEPYIDKAINIETQRQINSGGNIDQVEIASYRVWQKSGEIAAGTILGISISALFGIVFAYSRNSLLGSSNKKKALVLAGVMWFVLFLVPALKYPANPPAVGNPETIYYRESLYIRYLAVSGFSALALAFLFRKLGNKLSKKIIVPLIYAVVMFAAYLGLPSNPDKINIPMELVQTFRISSAFSMSIFWGIMAIVFGSLWDKLKPHKTTKIATI